MPYVKPNNLLNGTELQADELRENHEEARKYVNQEIVNNDISNIEFINLLSGEFQPITSDFVFHSSGNHFSYGQVDRNTALSQRDFTTSTIKNSDFYDTEKYVSVVGCGRTFYMPRPGNAILTVTLSTSERQEPDGVFSGDIGINTNYRVMLDGQLRQEKYYAFKEEISLTLNGIYGAASTGSPSSDSVIPLEEILRYNNPRRYIYITDMLLNLSQGWHYVSVVRDPRNVWSCITQKTFSLETFPNQGFQEITEDKLANNVRLNKENF